METTKERFENKFPNGIGTLHELDTTSYEPLEKELLAFIAQELELLAESIDRNVLSPTLCGKCNLNGELCKECYANRRANKSTADAADIIRAHAKSLKE